MIETAPYTLRASGDDVYRNFVLPIETSTTRYIRAWEFLPGSSAVHHATMQFDPRARRGTWTSRIPSPATKGWFLIRP